MVGATPYARELWQEARTVRRNSDAFSVLKRARAVWVLATLSFSANLGSGFSYDRKNNLVGKRFNNRKKDFGSRIMQRLENVCIENMDVLDLIKSRDSEDTFFYIDPPYISESMGSKNGSQKADQGHYKGYTAQDYDNMLSLLGTIKGKFLLSNYPSLLLQKHIEQNKRIVQSSEKPQQA